ncbi:MAG: hypothetical protein JO108_30600 [Acidobacteriaceae bacterium]|nr:hypothetical protein [Acidobacteriaceae bacterium]
MSALSLRQAAAKAGTSKSAVLRAIRSGRLCAPRKYDGGYAIDPAELLQVYPPKATHEIGRNRPAALNAAADGLAARIAVLEAEVRNLNEILEEVRRSRDQWREEVTRLTRAMPDMQAGSASLQDANTPLDLQLFRIFQGIRRREFDSLPGTAIENGQDPKQDAA